LDQFRLLLKLYRNPLTAFSEIIDGGRVLFAVCAALAALFLLQLPREIELLRNMAKADAYMAAHRAEIEAAQAELERNPPADLLDEPGDEEEYSSRAFRLTSAVDQFTAQSPYHYLSGLSAIALCFVPIAILVISAWQSLGSFGRVLSRDYLALLVCVLFAWAAAYLPLALGRAVLVAFQAPAANHPALWWTAHAYFIVLSIFAIRMVFATDLGHAAGATACAWAGSIGGICLFSLTGFGLPWLMSPCLLYYLYSSAQGTVLGFGNHFRSRQNLKRHLETATLNPKDADAHYQLGLIYQQRRQFAMAAERFTRAIQIDPSSADAHHQLGCIARVTEKFDEAIEHLRTAVRYDDKCSSSEVWRELGVAFFLKGQFAESREALAKYVERRPYDPEGLCWYGRALAKLGLHDAARQAFNEAIESVRTMPDARRRQVRAWGSEATKELRALGQSSHKA
jgi:tetratricopeptide (TPR) repeat protein